jgi:CHAT domain-containing protein
LKKLTGIIFILSFVIRHSSFCQTWQHYDSLRAVYLEKISYDTALVFADKALQIVKEKTGENDTLYANMLRALMDVNYYAGKYPIAIEYCKKEKEIRKLIQGEKHPDYATTLSCLASLYDVTGNYQAAEPLYLEAKEILKEALGEKHPYYASCLNDLAQLYWAMGNFSAAEPLYIESMNIRKEILGEKHPDYAKSLNNLAVLYQEMGNYPAAEALLLESKNIYKEVLGENHPDYALPLNNLAVLYWSIGNYPAAEPLLLEAIKIIKETLGEKHPDYAFYLNDLGELYQAMGNYPAAEYLLLESKNIRKETPGEKHPDYAISLNNLAGLYNEMGNYAAAEPLYIEAKNIRKEVLGEKNLDYATSLNNLAILYQSLDNYPAAESYYLHCLEVVNSAIVQNFAFLSEKEKEMFFKTQANDFENFYSFSLKRKKDNQEITKIVFNDVVKNKGLLLKSSTAMRTAILTSNDTSLISKYEKWTGMKREISDLYSTEISKREKDPEKLEQQANAIEKDLVRGSQVFGDFQKVQKLTWESVRNNLKRGEAAIEFIRFTEGKKRDTSLYCALLITPLSKQPVMIQLFYEKELEVILGNNSSNNLSYISSIYGTNQVTNEQLYNLIWQPLEKYLEGVKTVYYSPDGLLHKISFAAMSNGKNVYLCDNYILNRLSTTGKVAMHENSGIDKDLLAGIYGGIDYSTDSTIQKIWQYLPGTKSETDKINQIFKSKKLKTKYFSGKSATEGSFKELFTINQLNSKPEILHIASHGFFYPDPEVIKTEEEKSKVVPEEPVSFRGGGSGFGVWQFVMNKNPLMRSGLVFSGANNVWNRKYTGEGEDGVLTAQEVTQLDLRKTQLVVLSACETGLGDIKGSEGVYGLQRAFKMAGVKFLIMSLWQVPDNETSEFMTLFYEKLLLTKDIRKSFTETQSEMRKKYDPYYWAAFVLIE